MSSGWEDAKEAGNTLYKEGDVEGALAKYTEALSLCPDHNTKAVVLKNRAACNVKKENWAEVVEDCSASLLLRGNDVKALFRRAKGYEKLDKRSDALLDYVAVLKLDPTNKQAGDAARLLRGVLSADRDRAMASSTIIPEMMDQLLKEDPPSVAAGTERWRAARDNLLAKGQEKSQARVLVQNGVVKTLAPLLRDRTGPATQRHGTVSRLLGMLAMHDGKYAQSIINATTMESMVGWVQAALDNKHQAPPEGGDAAEELDEGGPCWAARGVLMVWGAAFVHLNDSDSLIEKIIDACLERVACTVYNACGRKTRDNVLNVLIKGCKTKERAVQMLTKGLVQRLMAMAASAGGQLKTPACQATFAHASVALAQIYDATQATRNTERFKQACGQFLGSKARSDSVEEQTEAARCLCALFYASASVASELILTNVTRLLLLVDKRDDDAKCAAAEAMALACTHKDVRQRLLTEGVVDTFVELWENTNMNISIRGALGLCKIASIDTLESKLLEEDTVPRLFKSVVAVMTSSDRALDDTRRFAIECLAFLSVDANVKEMVISNRQLVKQILEAANTEDNSLKFGLVTILVNLTNSYEKKDEKQEQMEQLQQYANGGKKVVENPKNGPEFVGKRVKQLVDLEIIVALAKLAHSDSDASRESVARVYLTITGDIKHRGFVVQHGGVKQLISLANKGTKKGMHVAGQALAKVAIVMNPNLAFAGQRAAELVRPLIQLLAGEHGLMQFEGLMALTNLAGMNDELRTRIVKEEGIKKIEELQFDDDQRIQRAATECLANMMEHTTVYEMYVKDCSERFDRIRLWTLFMGSDADVEDPIAIKIAAASGLAQLSHDKGVCERVLRVDSGLAILQDALLSGNEGLQHRALYIINNMCDHSLDMAQKLMDHDKILLVVGFLTTGASHRAKGLPASPQIRQVADEITRKLVEQKIIESPDKET